MAQHHYHSNPTGLTMIMMMMMICDMVAGLIKRGPASTNVSKLYFKVLKKKKRKKERKKERKKKKEKERKGKKERKKERNRITDDKALLTII